MLRIKQQDGIYTCRHFKRYFTLPSEVDGSTLVSRLNQDGVLKIEAERKATAIEDKDIKVQRDEEIEEKNVERKAALRRIMDSYYCNV